MFNKIILATKNKGKIREFKELFQALYQEQDIEVISLLDLDDMIEIIEDVFAAGGEKRTGDEESGGLSHPFHGKGEGGWGQIASRPDSHGHGQGRRARHREKHRGSGAGLQRV